MKFSTMDHLPATAPIRTVKKGAWSEEEDLVLRKCIEKFGEGKWREVPARAGLNRCRKSCRLRWLNYLKPDIKRGEFASDEIDLIIRMHKLLGNRWSLVAGRIPGRTANDIKNYCNTHLKKRQNKVTILAAVADDKIMKEPAVFNTTNNNHQDRQTTIKVFKPRPRTFLRNSFHCQRFTGGCIGSSKQTPTTTIKIPSYEEVTPKRAPLLDDQFTQDHEHIIRLKNILFGTSEDNHHYNHEEIKGSTSTICNPIDQTSFSVTVDNERMKQTENMGAGIDSTTSPNPHFNHAEGKSGYYFNELHLGQNLWFL